VLKTAICNLFGIRYPIIQGGMAHLATAELASAVSNAGGLGIIAAANYDAEWLRHQIHQALQLTRKPFGVNLLLPSPCLQEQIAVILEEKIPVIATGAGNPGPYLNRFKKAGIKVMSVVGNVELARKVEKCGVDAVVAEGMEAGGHIGNVTTMTLVPQVVDAVNIPVIAAGGIGDGRGMAAALALGAQGIQMGTRFICSQECIAHPDFKNRILKASDSSTVVTGSTTGHPIRCLANKFTTEYSNLEKTQISPEELDHFGWGRLHLGIIEGNLEEGSLMAGQISGLIKEIKPVKVIIDEIVRQAAAVLRGLSTQCWQEGDNA
jgi:enoyl-[acyl-carrier protein] reductase II